MNTEEYDMFIKCSQCHHQKGDHDTAAKDDKKKCLIGNCKCKTFVPDRKYHKK